MKLKIKVHMNKHKRVKFVALILITILMLLTCHYFLHGLEREDGHCLLCDLLTTGFTSIEWFKLLLLLFFCAKIPQIQSIPLRSFAFLQTQLRAPPYPAY
jgi:hypothetical protein